MKKIILILVLLVVLTSCKKADRPACDSCLTFYFENPQPNNDSELTGFPAKFKGLYMNSDSIFIRIEEDRILRESYFKIRIHKNELDSLKQEFDIENHQLVEKATHKKLDLLVKGDSLEIVSKDIDTIFRFSLNNKAKRINGQLVLSRRDSIFWNVQFLSIEKNTIKFKNIYEKEDLKKLDSVTQIKGIMLDSTSYLIKPTRREFKDILKIKDLGTDLQYDKVSK
ncbi:lipoprotein [Flavobacterium pectinovorum]|uniref:Type IV secretion system putative lipoprotein virB7 n=1 Tax=Flavobacterium pectinovorum TaxID=29533 RepID=A0A502F111_9FLAO|nr:lipoprotein [Flavobacterium pectinovorum]TPG43895.1 hypothetical protein EAH81_04915 [Flavobacterium pectinovorum]